MPEKRTQLQERYELKEVLGRGGMGVVYRAYDSLMRRDVALKTLIDLDNPAIISLFYKEWSVLANMVHPNVISIYDIGEFDENGARKPFFVMPLLPGAPLDKLIKDASPRLSVPGVLEIIDQAARGLQAAHEQGLVHRDIKPSNIFVMDDNSVKVIDFGIAREASGMSRTTLKGTLFYMAPEQFDMKPPSALSDLFALAVVTYEALTRRRPFQGATESEVVEAIRKASPPPISELNHEVGYAISQVVHKAMAKHPWHRFGSVREYGEALQKAMRGERLECLDSSKLKPRLERAAQSFSEGDYSFASEVLAELEAEGHLDQDLMLLRGQVDQAVRQTRIRQMLENARRFFEAGEYPLALRKIQEALELDPENAAALALKSQVEKERRARKISEWIALTRQHLDNLAFRQAREALDNVLELKPNDTGALALMAELGRREEEVSHLREEKSQLYHAAVEAWEKGEVTSALSKLEVLVGMDKDLPETDSGRSSTYQRLFSQVRSEHDAIRNSYEEARSHLAAENFEAAGAICKQFLAKYPNHALFQALKFDVDERQRQKLSAVIAETDRRVEEEPDLDRRVSILEEVLKRYPGEPHFERALRTVRDKCDLVNSIVAKARYFEERGQFTEALDQWQILRSIHGQFPGLEFEIQRLMKRQDQQAREQAKANWVEQIDKHLETGDYGRALRAVESALDEFPGDAELVELSKLVRKQQDCGREAMHLVDRAREASEQGAAADSLGALREAYRLDPRSAVIRAVLLSALLEEARSLVETDWEAAGRAVEEALALEPNHAPAQSLASRIGDRKREEFVAWCLAQARRMQTEGDLAGALAVAAQGLGTYPNEPRLEQLQSALRRAQAAETATTIPPAPTAGLPPRPPASDDPIPEASALLSDPVVPDASTALPPPARPLLPAVRFPSRPVWQAGLGAAAVLILLAGGITVFKGRSRKPLPSSAAPLPARIRVSLRATPAGALIESNGQVCGASSCDLELAPGSYDVQASLPGYETASSTLKVLPGSPAPSMNFALQPSPPRISISSDLAEGAVQLDGEPAGKIVDGVFESASISPGSHVLAIESGSARATLNLKIASGTPPSLTGAIDTAGLRAFVIVQQGGTARLYASAPGFQASLDGKPVGALEANGLNLENLSPGSHELLLNGLAGQHDHLNFDAQPAAVVYASLRTNRILAVLRIEANVDGADVYIGGSLYRRKTARGRLLVFEPPRPYTVRIQKEGFAPQEQQADLKAGEETRVIFKLVAAKAALAIRHAPAGAEVWVDGTRLGAAAADGSFLAANLDVGRHSLALKHEDFKTVEAAPLLEAGKTLEWEGAMESQTGTVTVDLSPAGVAASLRVRREGEMRDREVSGPSFALPPGVYVITGSAPRYQDSTASVRVIARRTVTATLVLKSVAVPEKKVAAAAPAAFGLEDWLKLPGWTKDGAILERKGGEFNLMPLDVSAARIVFSIVSLKGKRLAWVAGYRDPKNYYLFELDDKNFTHSEITNGKRSDPVKILHGLDRKSFQTLSLTISPQGLEHELVRDERWQVLDKWEIPTGCARGKFGFLLPGKDEIGLAEFKLTSP